MVAIPAALIPLLLAPFAKSFVEEPGKRASKGLWNNILGSGKETAPPGGAMAQPMAFAGEPARPMAAASMSMTPPAGQQAPLIDPEIQKYMYQQQMGDYLRNLGGGILQAAAGGQGFGGGLAQGLAAAGQGARSDPASALQLQGILEQRRAQQRQSQGFEGLLAQASGQGPGAVQYASAGGTEGAGGAAPSKALSPSDIAVARLLGPVEGAKFIAKKMGEKDEPLDLKASDLVEVAGESGPEYVLAEEAAGRRPYKKPEGASSPIGDLAEDLAAGRITADQFNAELARRNRPLATASITMPSEIKLTTGTATDAQKTVLNTRDLLSGFNEMEQDFRPEYLTLPEQAVQGGVAMAERLGIPLNPDMKAGLEEYTAFARNTTHQMNEYLHNMSGAAITPQEATRLQSEMPNMGDSPSQFQSKMQAVMKEARSKVARYSYALQHGINFQTAEDLGRALSMRQFETAITNEANEEMQKRITSGMPEDQAKAEALAMMKQRYGL